MELTITQLARSPSHQGRIKRLTQLTNADNQGQNAALHQKIQGAARNLILSESPHGTKIIYYNMTIPSIISAVPQEAQMAATEAQMAKQMALEKAQAVAARIKADTNMKNEVVKDDN
jgi:hypothetical protein